MGTMNRDVQNQNPSNRGDGNVGGATGGVGSPISNEAYNVITALQSKLEGLEAYRKYSQDQGGQVWSRLSQIEQQSVGLLVDELERIVKEGKLRMKEPGNANA